MKKMTIALGAAIALVASIALAIPEQPATVSSPGTGTTTGTGISNADLSTSPVSNAIPVAGYSLAMLKTQFDGSGTATDVSYYCEESDTGAAPWFEIPAIDSEDKVRLFQPLYETGVSHNYTIRLDVTGYVYIRCGYSGTGANSSDKVTLTVRRVRGI